jgi:hypothetical protein
MSPGFCHSQPRMNESKSVSNTSHQWQCRTPSASSAPPTMSAPALLASSAAFPSAKTRTLSLGLAFGSLGRATRPLGMTEPLGIAVFTVSSYVAFGVPTSTDCNDDELKRHGHAQKSWTYPQDMYRVRKCHLLCIVDTLLCFLF